MRLRRGLFGWLAAAALAFAAPAALIPAPPSFAPAQVALISPAQALSPGLGVILRASPRHFSAEAKQFLDRLFPPESDAYANQDAAFIDTLVASGTWAKCDVIHVPAAANVGTALINWKSSSYNGVYGGAVGAPTWTLNRGFNGTGTSFINSQFNPSTSGSSNFLQNDASVFIWSLTPDAQAQASVWTSASTDDVSIYPRWTDDKLYGAVNRASSFGVTTTTGKGFLLVNRTASNVTKFYVDNSEIGSPGDTGASAALKNATVIYGLSSHIVAMFGLCASLNATDRSTILSAGTTLLTARGALP